jgi:acetyl-CoA synthetase
MQADPAALNLGDLATERHAAAGRADDHALVWYGAEGTEERYTYGELADASARAASLFQAQGVQRGDRVVFLLPHVPQLYFAALGALRAGALISVLGAGRNMDYMRNILARFKPKVMVTVPAFKNSLGALRPEAKDLKTVVYLHRSALPAPPLSAGEALWNVLYDAAPPQYKKAATTAADKALLHYTDLGMSGAVLSQRSALALYASARDALEMRAGQAALTVTMPGEPMFLTYALLAPFLIGARAVALEDPARFQRYGDLAAAEEPRVWYSGQKALDVILRTDPNLGALLRGCRNIGVTAPYDPSLVVMTSESYGSPIHCTWWDREFGVIQTAEFRACDLRPGSIGRPVPGTDVRVVDDQGQPLDVGMPGYLAVKIGPGCPFVEYWGDPGLTQTQVRDGWFVTRHSAKIDADGWIWLES